MVYQRPGKAAWEVQGQFEVSVGAPFTPPTHTRIHTSHVRMYVTIHTHVVGKQALRLIRRGMGTGRGLSRG
jgi:hypothetical protein